MWVIIVGVVIIATITTIILTRKHCKPNCGDKICGSDGCGGSCGDCSNEFECLNGTCQQRCLALCPSGYCGTDGCGGICPCDKGQVCYQGKCCLPNCQGRCEDGCGGTCPACAPGQVCLPNGYCCQPNCLDERGRRKCNVDNGCGQTCNCPSGQICHVASGLCVQLN